MLRRKTGDAGTTPDGGAPELNGNATRRQRIARSPFGRWARRRPFVGGVLMVVGGAIVMVFPFLPVKNYVTAGVAVGWYDPDVGLRMVHPPLGLAGGLALVVCGALTLRRAGTHHLVGVIGVIAGFVSFVLNHLGGFVVGMLLGIVGGALTYSWMPGPRDGNGLHVPRRHDDDPAGGDDGGDADDDPAEPNGRTSLTDPEFFSLVKR